AESVVHIMATSMALFSIILSHKPPDESHPYGHNKIEYFSAGIEGFLIFTAAIVIIYSAINDIIFGSQLKQLDIGALIIFIAAIINLYLGYYLIRIGKKTNSITLIADGKHVLTDSYTSAGVIIGVLLVIITGYTLLDPLFAIAVAINILYTGFVLIRESIGGLMNESNFQVVKKLADVLSENKKNYWIDIHELRYWQSGDRIFLDFHLILPHYFTIQQSHTEENKIEKLIQVEFPNSQIKIHFDYCISELCKFCSYDECKVRMFTKEIDFKWDAKKMAGVPIYQTDKYLLGNR
ncbi:MAG: cation transporter, partial [Ignavibacteriaceae bacterium]|nr:cation transporter [Ignavibacteriaceae bacterium]